MKYIVAISQIFKSGGAENLGIKFYQFLQETSKEPSMLVQYNTPIRQVSEPVLNHIRHTLYFCHSAIQIFCKLRKIKEALIEVSSIGLFLIILYSTLGKKKIKIILGLHFVHTPDSLGRFRLLSLILASKLKSYSIYGVSNSALDSWKLIDRNVSKSALIYNGIEPKFFLKTSPPETDRDNFWLSHGLMSIDYIFISIGRFVEYKNQLQTIEAFLSQAAFNNCSLCIIGGKENTLESQKYFDKIESLINDHRHRILLLDHNDLIDEYLKYSDCLVHVSRKESFGLVILEAAASRCGLVLYPIEGITEVTADMDYLAVELNTESISKGMLKEMLNDISFKDISREKNYIISQRFNLLDRNKKLFNFINSV